MLTDREITDLLRSHHILPTVQRIKITGLLLSQHAHYSAEQVFALVNADDKGLSKATVYNTLGLLVEKGLVRQVVVDPTRVFYDSNTVPHHHFYHVDSGELRDIDAGQVRLEGLPVPPEGTVIDGVDVVVRVRHTD